MTATTTKCSIRLHLYTILQPKAACMFTSLEVPIKSTPNVYVCIYSCVCTYSAGLAEDWSRARLGASALSTDGQGFMWSRLLQVLSNALSGYGFMVVLNVVAPNILGVPAT